MDTLNDKVVVVTGGASGIGLALATAVTDRGARVVIADVEQSALGTVRLTRPSAPGRRVPNADRWAADRSSARWPRPRGSRCGRRAVVR